MVASSPKKIPFFPLNFNLLKENAAREEVNAPTTSTGIATVKVFLKPLKIPVSVTLQSIFRISMGPE